MKTAQTKKRKPSWYEKSFSILNRLIKKHPNSFLLFDFFEGKLVAKSTDRHKIKRACSQRLAERSARLIMHEPDKKSSGKTYIVLRTISSTTAYIPI